MTQTVPAEAGSATPLRPVAPKARIAVLDLIRGLAILGILAVNADGFAGPMSAYGSIALWPFSNEGGAAIAKWVVDAFFHEKCITLFSMLFGVSLFLVGGDRTDKARGRLVWRRVGWLFVIAMIHGFLIWWGDVLSLYAVTAMVAALWLRGLKARTLMRVGLPLFLLFAALQMAPAAINLAPPEQKAKAIEQFVPGPERQAEMKAKVAADIAEGRGSFQGAQALNARQYVNLMMFETIAVIPTLGLMLIGLSLFKSGFLAGRSSAWRYGVMIAVGAASLAVVGWLEWQASVDERLILGADGVVALLTPLISLAYASILILLWRGGATWLTPLARAGQMAFTNYLTQSIIMTSIFYGGRGALLGQVDRPALWGIVIAIWVLQLIWSSWWLSRFSMGPLEWVWRCLSYGRLLPIRRDVAGAPAIA
ncbi:hypothetical protein ASG17_02540 [Brevundimonas sp. Leaf363]|uniref:DUF418 domain-containing protein n=1 Tax=Brevundimonas sp. Leaf363 TaxID=1736353 RepID=UPI0006FFA477|nr:DUF418 domain-containing protein [Brevundimonas sp. Leaf363]KQS57610.1 hypothetical protein ASG17_02540 [Brevundimonas sp. Leaf363]